MMAILSGGMTWAVARRYGRWWALVVPILALAAVGLMIWRASQMSSHDATGMTAVAVGLVGPSLAGALFGMALARRGAGRRAS